MNRSCLSVCIYFLSCEPIRSQTIFRSLICVSRILEGSFNSFNSVLRVIQVWLGDVKMFCNICPGNICLCDICLYQEYLSYYWPNWHLSRKHLSISGIFLLLEYLSSYWPDFNQTFGTQLFGGLNFYKPTIYSCEETLWTPHVCLYLCNYETFFSN